MDEQIFKYSSTNRILLIVVLILLILFIVLSIAFIFVPATQLNNTVNTINEESKQAEKIVNDTAADVEMTLRLLTAAGDKTNVLEGTLITFVRAVCANPIFAVTQACMNFV